MHAIPDRTGQKMSVRNGEMTMNLEQLTALGLSEDVAKKVLESHKEAVKDFIPKERFDEVNNEKKRLEGVVTERDKQIVELGKVDAEGLQSKITELTEANKLAEKNHAEQLTAQAKEFKMTTAFTDAKVRNSKAVKALLDNDAIKLDGDKLVGLDEQLKKLKETDGYLFEADDNTNNGGNGDNGNNGNGTPPKFSVGNHNNNTPEPSIMAKALGLVKE